jgi:hypothetical protein
MRTEEDCEKDKRSNVKDLEILESLAVQAHKGRRDEDGEEPDGKPEALGA